MNKLDVDICRNLREKGKSYQEIADSLNTSKQLVYYTLDKAGVMRKTKYSKYYEEWEELYRSGIGMHLIAEKFNCSIPAVYHHLKKKFVIKRGQLVKKRNLNKKASEATE